nr:immunoglobulin light chain junction region [Macaca mulatta]
CLQSKNSLYSF